MKRISGSLFRCLLPRRATLLVCFAILTGTGFLTPPPSIAQTVTRDSGTVNIKSAAVKWSGHGLKVELQTMPPDLAQAFFLGRGFSAGDASFIASTGCIFRSAMGHAGTAQNDAPITVELAKWRIITRDKTQPPLTRQDWAKIWAGKKVSKNAKTAFHWALFPTRQSYQAGDYNWGMISFALPPGSRFDLELYWRQAEKQQSTKLAGLECGK